MMEARLPIGTGTGTADTQSADAQQPPLRDYAVIGDCHGAALVSKHGSVDWCCLARFDADPIFCRLLDATRGGFFSIRPAEPAGAERAYLGPTNLLRTEWSAPGAACAVIDFMPVGRSPRASVHDYVSLRAPFWLVRVVEGLRGRVRLQVRYRPSVAFARKQAALFSVPGGVATPGGPWLYGDAPFRIEMDVAEAELEIREGEKRFFVVAARPATEDRVGRAAAFLATTRAFWEEWIEYCRYRGPYAGAVRRSALALKLLTYAPTGAVVAAPTTSLPERIGGERNWDYRYCWLRDSNFMLYALASLGYSGEARRFLDFAARACRASAPEVQVLYGVSLETELTERRLEHLGGYRDSRPVRSGNAAYAQRQLDVYGSMLDGILIYRRLGGRLDREVRGFALALGESIARRWQETEHGIWEERGEPRHHVYGKIMCWVGIDRLIRLCGARPEWLTLRDRIHSAILERGIGADGALTGRFGDSRSDAALLLALAVAFDAGDRILRRTVEAVERELRCGDLVLRYRRGDGLPSDEGAFLPCSFWLVDALLLLDRAAEATPLFERLCGMANDVGLFSEEIDPDSGELLGNFPQALTHLALAQSAANLELHRRFGISGVRGAHADRAVRAVGASVGLRGLWAAIRDTHHVGRLRSSKASVLDWKEDSL